MNGTPVYVVSGSIQAFSVNTTGHGMSACDWAGRHEVDGRNDTLRYDPEALGDLRNATAIVVVEIMDENGCPYRWGAFGVGKQDAADCGTINLRQNALYVGPRFMLPGKRQDRYNESHADRSYHGYPAGAARVETSCIITGLGLWHVDQFLPVRDFFSTRYFGWPGLLGQA